MLSTPSLRRKLLGWYDRNRRELPWRLPPQRASSSGTTVSADPYPIWLSEIMLQQTRVAAVLEHYGRFLERFPTIQTLAAARLESVLAAWSGLGYYRRARNLHLAARQIVREGFPETLEGLRRLPGVGRYTAAAVASIAFGVPAAVVDGNVERVLKRLYAREPAPPSEMWRQAEELLDRSRPGDWNQAMMELGATVCLPLSPACSACPLSRLCLTNTGSSRTLRTKSSAPARLHRETAYLLARKGQSVYLVRRPPDATLMPGLWELPECETPAGVTALFRLRHAITVTDYRVSVYDAGDVSGNGVHARTAASLHPSRQVGSATNSGSLRGLGRWVSRERLSEMALTGLTRKALRRVGLI